MTLALVDTEAWLFEELEPPLTEQEAIVEADRCLECGGAHAPAPCSVACPAGIDVPSFVAAIADGDDGRAAEVIFAENLLGGTCARVCPTELLCEGACVLLHEGRPPIEIGRLQRHASDAALQRSRPLRSREAPSGFRVAVIGAGPAGLACAGELAARGHEVTVYDERPEPGGLVRYAIAPYRQHVRPLPEEAALVEALGVRIVLGRRIDRPRLLAIAGMNDAVVLAVGMGADATPHLPGEDLDGVWRSLAFVEALKTGRAPRIGRTVAVIGGGNTAIDVAVEARRLGAAEVRMLYRRTEAEMPAYPAEVELAREEGVVFEWLTAPTRFLGCRVLEGVECVRMRLGEPDPSGRARPEPVPGSEYVVPAETAIVAIGQEPRPEFADLIGSVDPATARTGTPKLYAAGDAVNGGATVVEAVREAKIAARSVDQDLRGAS
ncbi:MAG TPA: NAD(P)-dependent oxidoreductase [Gaiellaceae bacterium]|jgi:glutamate synthase (NADPH/NADH) small chain